MPAEFGLNASPRMRAKMANQKNLKFRWIFDKNKPGPQPEDRVEVLRQTVFGLRWCQCVSSEATWWDRFKATMKTGIIHVDATK